MYLYAKTKIRYIMKKTRTPRFDKSWQETIELYPDAADREALTTAIRNYQIDGIEPQLPPALMVAFLFLRPTIDRRRRNAEKARARRNTSTPDTPESEKPAPRATVISPYMLVELYGRRIESDPALQSRIAADVSEKCRCRVTAADVARNVGFFNDYLLYTTDVVDSEESYMSSFRAFLRKLMSLPPATCPSSRRAR
ncbi:MAG: hypothetical protein DBY35_10900 [Bacteroidales bacterium]|nr:MAG: hypothetical protein DBY35_10900 [Bacteroidales bacterium]